MPGGLTQMLGGLGGGGGASDGGGGGGGLGKWLSLAMLPLGITQNIMASGQQNKLFQQYLQGNQRTAAGLTPQAIAAGMQSLLQPLSTSLRQTVGNSVQADLAQRGLAQAPGIFGASMAQALAPYALKQQEDALQGYLQGTLGQRFQLPWGVRGPQGTDMTGLLRMIMMGRQQNGQDGSGVTTDVPLDRNVMPYQSGGPNDPNAQLPNIDWSSLTQQPQQSGS